jgi:hypothetical protein
MSNAWDDAKNFDLDELAGVNIDVHATRYSTDQSLKKTLAQIFEKEFSYDISIGPGPYIAVVLDILSGPQVKNQATTGGRVNTTTLNIDEYPYPFLKNRKDNNSAPPVIIKAKVLARLPDSDIEFPVDKDDMCRLDSHGEYWQFREDETLSKIDIGSLVWITFNNTKEPIDINCRPDGKIVGIHSTAVHHKIKTHISARLAFNPECQGVNALTGPAGGFYLGHTIADPNPNIGPPIRKIKGHIKTGIYGNGTPQTKAHFVEALKKASDSRKHRIPEAAPGPANAFIWIGTLKNNGYMDLLDRPISQGRETIIYAPMTLDLASPVEIKYYFHDKAGFGHAHIDGPSAEIDQAVENAVLPGNDFREKIGPAIKDLNKDGRNYILVIPEMSYSRGYGTKNNDLERINELFSGQTVSQGTVSGETIRTKVNAATRGAVKNYLSALPIDTTKNLLHVTPLREREFATFDGSFTGGKFGEFHQEVLDVLDEHLGTIYDKVEFLSILADGLGGPALASILNNVSVSSTRSEARTSFKNTFFAKPVRIDYVTDQLTDARGGLYGSYFVTERQDGTLDTVSPSYNIWRNFLLEHSEQAYTEFNYITKPAPAASENYFFEQLGKINEFSKHMGLFNPSQKQKFSFYTVGQEIAPESFISFHINSKPGAYAFSMINNFLESTTGPSKKSDAGSSRKPSFDAVPDHAYAVTTKPSVGDLAKIRKRRTEIESRISYFETLINLIVNPEQGNPCEIPKYKMFCEKDGVILTDGFSTFFDRYKKYLDDKKDYMETFLLEEGEVRIQQIINNKTELIKEKNRLTNMKISARALAFASSDPTSTGYEWKSLRTFFNKANFKENDYIIPGSPNKGHIAMIAGLTSAFFAYSKILKKVTSAEGRLGPESVNKLKPCPPKLGDPTTLGQFRAGQLPVGKSNESGNNCTSIKISVPNTFEELTKMIPYYPKKSDFSLTGKRVSRIKTKIQEVEGYRVSTFKYPARGVNNGITTKESPPLWACITDVVQRAWSEACAGSGYYPFEITNGIRGIQKPKIGGVTAYQSGVSLHSFGLAFDLDPFIAGIGRKYSPVYSVFTGAWSSGFVNIHGETLHNLGVYKEKPAVLMKNAYEADNRARMAENWTGAPSRYKGGGESGGAKQKYIKIMKSAKGSPIVPSGTNPTLWIILFCEKTGMKWGNGRFLKKRWKGGKIWSKEEKDRISNIFGIPDVVDRIQAISWNSHSDDHMHIHYWGNRTLIHWEEIRKASRKKG